MELTREQIETIRQWLKGCETGLVDSNVDALCDTAAEVSALKEQLEQTRVQLAGCGAAALGYADDCKQGEYGYSASLGDVLTLRRETVTLRAQLEAAKSLLTNYKSAAMAQLSAQLTAQPDGVRAAAQELSDRVNDYAFTPREDGGIDEESAEYEVWCACLEANKKLQAALAAPASSTPPEGKVRELARRLITACRQHDIGGVGTVDEYLNAQHALAIELAQTEALAAPAPACGACEIEKRHGIPSADPHTCNPAPACKTCGGTRSVVGPDDADGWPDRIPCPDCNPEPSSEVSHD